MNCTEFMTLLPMYPDNMPDEETRSAFLLHAAECPEDAARLAEQEALLASLKAMDEDMEVPAAFTEGWRAALAAEKKPVRPASRLRGWAIAAAAVLTVTLGTSLMRQGALFPGMTAKQPETPAPMAFEEDALPAAGGGSYAPEIFEEDTLPQMSLSAMWDMADWEVEEAAEAGAKIAKPSMVIRSTSLSVRSAQYDADLAQLESTLALYGGQIAYQSEETAPATADEAAPGRMANLRARVSDADLDALLSATASIGKVTYNETSLEDVTDSYYDAQTQLAQYAAQQERLEALRAQADTLSDQIELEAQYGEVLRAIETLQGQLSLWQAQAESATVSITLLETAPEALPEQPPLAQRLAEAFTHSLRNARSFAGDALVFLVMIAPYALCVAVVVLLGYSIVEIVKKRKKKENEK